MLKYLKRCERYAVRQTRRRRTKLKVKGGRARALPIGRPIARLPAAAPVLSSHPAWPSLCHSFVGDRVRVSLTRAFKPLVRVTLRPHELGGRLHEVVLDLSSSKVRCPQHTSTVTPSASILVMTFEHTGHSTTRSSPPPGSRALFVIPYSSSFLHSRVVPFMIRRRDRRQGPADW
jgi:hypothetical protein